MGICLQPLCWAYSSLWWIIGGFAAYQLLIEDRDQVYFLIWLFHFCSDDAETILLKATLLQVICLYQKVVPHVVMQYNFDFSKLLKGASQEIVKVSPLFLPASEENIDKLGSEPLGLRTRKLVGGLAGVHVPPAWLFLFGPYFLNS